MTGPRGRSWCLHKAFQAQQSEPTKLLTAHAVVIMIAEPLVFHAAEAPPNPRVQVMEIPPVSGPMRGEVVGRALNNSVEFHDDLRVQIARTAGQLLDLVFELVLRLGTHTLGPAREHEPEEGVTLVPGGDASFLGA